MPDVGGMEILSSMREDPALRHIPVIILTGIGKAQEDFLDKHAGNKAAEAFIESQRHETRLYYKYKEYYGYAFYIGKKR